MHLARMRTSLRMHTIFQPAPDAADEGGWLMGAAGGSVCLRWRLHDGNRLNELPTGTELRQMNAKTVGAVAAIAAHACV